MTEVEPTAAPFETGRERAQRAVIALGITILIDLVAVGSGLSQVALLHRMATGQQVTPDQVNWNDTRQQAIGMAQIGMLVVTGVLFLMWLHRAHRNLPALGARDLKFTPRWAVGWFFVPFYNLVRPLQVVREVWKASDPDSKDGSAWKDLPDPSLAANWWGCFLLTGIVSRIAGSLLREAKGVPDLVTGSWALVAADALSVPAAVLAILVVREIDRRQGEKARLAAPAGPPLPGA